MGALSVLIVTLTIFFGSGIVYFFFLLYKARSEFYYNKVRKGLPMPKWNPIFGHLLAIDKTFKENHLPPDIQMPDAFTYLSREFQKSDSLFYVDLWPFVGPLMLVSSPHYAVQACQQLDIANDRPEDLLWSLQPIAGGPNIFNTNGSQWKEARRIFSLGFNTNYILNQTEHVVAEAEVFVEILRDRCSKNEIFKLDDLASRYAMDISGMVTLNQRLHTQERYGSFAAAMRHTLDWHYMGDHKSSLIRRTPLIRLISWYNGRIMNNFLSNVLDERYASLVANKTTATPNKSAIDLLIAEYANMHKEKRTVILDDAFKKWAIPQLRMMFFVGFDSTASTICYALYLLSQNPSALRKVRDEHDTVFGKDIEMASALMREQPHLLNKLTYTTAVIKEVLRLFTPASGFRAGKTDAYLRSHEDGNIYPTENTRVWVLHGILHRNPKYWKDPLSFIPERFLVGPEHPLYPMRGAWRPFEHGPRNCFGQPLAMLDLQVTLVMTMRTFDVKEAYDEWYLKSGVCKSVPNFEGEKAYQVGQGAAHPAYGFPCRFYFRK